MTGPSSRDGRDGAARPATARWSRGRRLAERRRETRRGIDARSAAVRLRGSRSARRSARSEEGARGAPRERSVFRRAVAKRSFAEPPESSARRRQEQGLRPGQPPQVGMNEDLTMQAIRRCTEALSAAGLTVLSLDETQTRLLASEHRDCNEEECGRAVASELHVDYAVLVMIWLSDGTPTAVVVQFIPEGGGAPIAGEGRTGEDFEALIDAAIRDGLVNLRADRTGTLRITTEPTGAVVRVDGRGVGRSPVQRTLPQGSHRVEAEHEGLFGEETVEVVAHSATDLELVLHEVEGAEAPVATSGPNWGNFLAAGLAFAAAIVLAIDPIATLSSLNECTSRFGRTCERWVEAGPRTIGLLISSGLSVGAGVVFMVVPPFPGRGGGASAQLGYEGMF